MPRGRPKKNKDIPEVVLQPAPENRGVEVRDPEPAPERPKPATKPWMKKDTHKPWRRDFFKLDKQPPDRGARFVKADNVEYYRGLGYDIANPDLYGKTTDNVIDDGSALGRRIVRRGMILMDAPKDTINELKNDIERRNRLTERQSKDIVKAQVSKLARSHNLHVQLFDES